MEGAKATARGQTLPVTGRRPELCWLGPKGTDHIRHAPAPARQTREQTPSTRVGGRGGKGFNLLRCSQCYSWSLRNNRRELLTFREQGGHPSAHGTSSRREEIDSDCVVGLSLSQCLSSSLLPFSLQG